MKAHHSQRHLSLLCLFNDVPQYTLVITLNMPNKVRVYDVENAPFRLIRRFKCKYKKLTLVIKSYLIYQTKMHFVS